VNPTVLAAEGGHYVELNVSEPQQQGAAARIESLARPIISMPEFGQMAGLAMWIMEANVIGKIVLPGTLSFCCELGNLIRKVKGNDNEILSFLNQRKSEDYKASVLYKGTLQAAETSTGGGFDCGSIDIEVGKSKHKRLVKIIFQNESLLLWDPDQGEPRIMAPDLITYLINGDKVGHPGQWTFTNSDIIGEPDKRTHNALKPEFIGKDITLIGLRAPAQLLRTEQTLGEHRDRYILLGSKKSQQTLPENYRVQRALLGYHGDYIPFNPSSK